MNKEIDTYIAKAEDARRDLMIKLQDMILDKYPTAQTKISYGIPHYQLGAGWVFLGYWKQGVSIYTGIIPSLNEFKQKHPKIKMGKGCINLKLKDSIPWQDIAKVLDSAMMRM